MPMEVKDIFEATSKNVREMLSERGLGLYVPPYQRPYGWDKDKVDKLVDDILHGYRSLLSDPESFTFLGTVITIHDINFITVQPIVRPDVPAKVLTVIDGQQRLTSLLVFCLALHNQIRLAQAKMLKGRTPDKLSGAEQWLNGQALRLVEELSSTFHERQAYGDAPPYPRMIRSFDDQWARSARNAQYVSPIAHLIASYLATFGKNELGEELKLTEFKPKKRDGHIEGEEALVERYNQLVRTIRNIAAGSAKDDLEELPTLKEVAGKIDFQRAMLNHDFPAEVVELISGNQASPEFCGLLNVLLVSSYVLNRVALTVVRGKNEHYAFTVFESLNTTGEPLTAFETFKPRVVSAETLEGYESSRSRRSIDEISRYLSTFKVGERLQVATRDLLIYFASAETGTKLSKRLADQRRYLKEEFERHEANEQQRVEFINNLRDVAVFIEGAWGAKPSLPGLPVEATSDVVKLCLAFLNALNHSITIAPLSRFYARALQSSDEERPQAMKDFEGALKAMTAFSVLWRGSRRTTDKIDSEYRELLLGVGPLVDKDVRGKSEAPFARSQKKDPAADAPPPAVNLDDLKARLRARLANAFHGDIPTRERFVEEGAKLPSFQINKVVARFLLLAAYHDAIEDAANPGLIVKGRTAVSPCLTYAGFTEEKHLTLEHIAPQQRAGGWAEAVWAEKDLVHSLGNLVLAPLVANSSFSNRSWAEKKVLYAALSSRSQQEAETKLAESGVDFGDSTQAIAMGATHLPHLSAVSLLTDEWSADFIRRRSERVLGLAWDELHTWLQ